MKIYLLKKIKIFYYYSKLRREIFRKIANGEPVLKKYMPIYNKQEKKFGFNNVIYYYKRTYRILGIVGYIFFVILSVILYLLISYLYKKHKDRKIRKVSLKIKIKERKN